MGRLIVSTQTTVDGVMDQLEDWFEEKGDHEHHGVEELRAADAVLLGRKTYEQLSKFWPEASGPYADLINPMPKYVASRTLQGPLAWNSQLLAADPTQTVAALKEQYAGSLILYGCGELANVLARSGLVDEVRLWLHPVVWGDGERLLRPGKLPIRLRLITVTPFDTGVVRLSYQPVT